MCQQYILKSQLVTILTIRAASCPGPGQACGWDYYSSPDPNPHVLKGALVGGPDQSDNYNDDRTNFVV